MKPQTTVPPADWVPLSEACVALGEPRDRLVRRIQTGEIEGRYVRPDGYRIGKWQVARSAIAHAPRDDRAAQREKRSLRAAQAEAKRRRKSIGRARNRRGAK